MLDFDAVAFDLDGTLYPNYRLYARLVPFILKEHRLLRAMGKARDALRAGDTEAPFYDEQARLMAALVGGEPEAVKARAEKVIYRAWEEHFRRIKLFPRVKETIEALRGAGLKTGLLSDFPPERKLGYLGLADGWDAVLCSERTGRLKPHPRSFLLLAETMGVEPGRVLYVGNSVRYDVEGARGAGMKTALVAHPYKRSGGADFVFTDYRQLRRFVLR